MYGRDILCGISNCTFEIPHKISYPYIKRGNFYTALKFYELLDFRARKSFWNAPLSYPDYSDTCSAVVISTAWMPVDNLGRNGRDIFRSKGRHYYMHFFTPRFLV